MKNQMELFDDGGLADEGGTVDPVSGNEVPAGSTQEEVRDDIPAQLSEGEFVLPADVVRYHGLEKIMQLRDEAKQGLQKMEDMGQMGNSEEAILDDDIPFSIDDLDMEDDGMLEYNQGGVVQPQGFTGIQQTVPSAFTSYQPQYTPYQAQQVTQPAYVPPTQQVVPTMQQQQLPQFEQFIATPTGAYDEMRTYKNATTGETRQIPFVGGNPIYPIPEGFTYQDPEKVTTETVTAAPTTVGTTQVAQQQDDGDERPMVGGRTVAEIRQGMDTVKDRYQITGSRGFDLLNLLPGAGLIKSFMDVDSAAIGTKEPADIQEMPLPARRQVQMEREKYENVLNTEITGYVGNEVGDLDVVTGGVFDARGRAVNEDGGAARGETGTRSYASFRDWMNDMEAGRESGWRGGPINKATYDKLSDKGKANYNAYSDITGSIQHEEKETPAPKEVDVPVPTPRPTPEPQRDDNNDDNRGGGGRQDGPGTAANAGFSSQATGDRTSGRVGFNKGGDVTKQMKKSGLTSKK